MNTASLNLTVGQGGHDSEPLLFSLISLEEAPSRNKVSIHLNLLFGGFICVLFAYLGGIHWGLIWVTFRPCFCMYLVLMPFPSILSGKYLIKPISGSGLAYLNGIKGILVLKR